MKIKVDFITNSSSASIYLYVRSRYKSLSDFSASLNKIFENEPRVRETVTFMNPKDITFFGPDVFRLEEHVSMYNDHDDIPWYLQWFIFEFLKDKAKFSTYGIEEIIKLDVDFDY
jgi:hypothetical protein